MSEPIEWLPDGTPYSPRFGDRYHSETGVLQARRVFVEGCGLPGAWSQQPQWRILETGFGFGLNFLVTWAAWRADPDRPRLLHFVSTEAWPVSAADLQRAHQLHAQSSLPLAAHLAPLADALLAQWWGLVPGIHRLAFEGGRVLLTLCVGDAQAQLRQQTLTADAVYLDGFSPDLNPELWDLHTLKAVARCCRRGTRLASWTSSRTVRDHLTACGFEVQRVPGTPPKRHNTHAVFAPAWTLRDEKPADAPQPPDAALHDPLAARTLRPLPAATQPGTALVIGAGLAGAAVASSLARRGWQVEVLEQGADAASGASGLPAGVFAPHISPDDSVLSRLSRAGVRTTELQARQTLQEGVDWALCGVLEHCVDGKLGLPGRSREEAPASMTAWDDWSRPAQTHQLAQAHLPPDTVACWHPRGGWLQPPALVRALLRQPGIHHRPHTHVNQLHRLPNGRWQALGTQGEWLGEASLVIVTAGFGSADLLPGHGPLRALRGQISMGATPEQLAQMPPFPVNGNGNLVPNAQGQWVLGSTFERGVTQMPPTAPDQCMAHETNQGKLRTLLPHLAHGLEADFAATLAAQAGPTAPIQSWGAVRCVYPDRLPLVGPVDPQQQPGLWVCTAMGARGLTLSQLCGELLAALLHHEPLPVDDRLAQALWAAPRLAKTRTAPENSVLNNQNDIPA